MKANALFKMSLILGVFVGLLVGTVLYMFGGYYLSYVLFSILFLASVPFLKKVIPDERGDTEVQTSFDDQQEDTNRIRNRLLF